MNSPSALTGSEYSSPGSSRARRASVTVTSHALRDRYQFGRFRSGLLGGDLLRHLSLRGGFGGGLVGVLVGVHEPVVATLSQTHRVAVLAVEVDGLVDRGDAAGDRDLPDLRVAQLVLVALVDE